MKFTTVFVALVAIGLASAAIQPDGRCCECINGEGCRWACCLAPNSRSIPIAAPVAVAAEPDGRCCPCAGKDTCSSTCCF
ncbi:MAG: hypothetical protein BYD32DRAFT_418471 [Podila humilis]|nr:MAG: hypothetical protein BYD32DRAFT_418471 [Podila humilis]